MADDANAIAGLLGSITDPLGKAGIDPDEALLDRKAAMAKLMGPTAPPSWVDQVNTAQNDVPPQPGLSPNGNQLPAGLQSRAVTPPPAQAAPSTAVPASVTQNGSPDLAAANTAFIGQAQNDYTKASNDVDKMAAQPDLASQTKNLEAQRANQAAPLPAYDPQTGKLLSEYKPSFAQRLMRGVDGFARGGVFGAIDPKVAGETPYGAPNAQYQREVQQRQGNVASLDQQLQTAATNYKNTSERLKAVAAARKELPSMAKDIMSGSVAQQDQPNKQLDAQTNAARAKAEQQRVDETGRHNQIDEEQTALYQKGELGARNAALGIERGRLGLEQKKFDTQYGAGGANGGLETGDDFLKTLDPGNAQLVKSIANGDRKPPSASDRSSQAQALNKWVQTYDPSYTDARYKGKQAFKGGKDSDDIVSLATAMEHLDSATKHSQEVGFAPGLSFNAGKGDAAYNKDMQLFSEETGKLVKSGVVTKEELGQLQSGLNSVRQSVRDEALGELTNLLGGKVSAKMQKYKTATGRDLDPTEFFDKPTQERLNRFGVISTAPSSKKNGGAGGFNWDEHPKAE